MTKIELLKPSELLNASEEEWKLVPTLDTHPTQVLYGQLQKAYWKNTGAIALSYPPRVRVRVTAKLSATFFHDESSITIGGGTKVQ